MFSLFIILILLTSCSKEPTDSEEKKDIAKDQINDVKARLCGDSRCDELEKMDPKLCPQDCKASTSIINPTVGVVGCSITINALNGYEGLNGSDLWLVSDVNNYGGGSIIAWSEGIGTDKRWTTFETTLRKYPNTTKIWWELCSAPQVKDMSYEDVVDILNEIKRIAAGKEIYASTMPLFTDTPDTEFCMSEDSPALVKEHVDRMIEEGIVKRGPEMTSLGKDLTDTQGCHANSDGEIIWGNDLLDFFG